MQLFQPTNITPDMRGSFGNGVVVDYSNGLIVPGYEPEINVSWQVNGNTPMTAFQIDFYKNDGSSDLIWSTGKLTDNCPFYSVDGAGNPIFFTYTVPMENGLENYSEGQIKITQYWGQNAEYSVEQTSPSVYIVRLSLVPNIQYTSTAARSITFTGSFDGAQEDGLMWHRWVLEDSAGNAIRDSGKVYGNAELTFSYEGFLPGNYTVRLSGETSAGVAGDSGAIIRVRYDIGETGMDVLVSRACNGESAVEVGWPKAARIPLTGSSGSYSASGDFISLAEGANMAWDRINGVLMSLGVPWSFLWRGVLMPEESIRTVFSLRLARVIGLVYRGWVRLVYEQTSETTAQFLLVYIDSGGTETTIATVDADFSGGEVFAALTPDGFFIAWDGLSQTGTYPAESLYPSDTLYPGGVVPMSSRLTKIAPAQWDTVTSLTIVTVTLYGSQACRFCKAVSKTVEEHQIVNSYLGDEPDLDYSSDVLFLLSKNSQDYDAGNYYIEDVGGLEGVTLYRRDEGKNILEKVGDFSLNTTKVLDYGARSQQGPYSYYLYVKGTETYTAAPAVSDSVSPCFWNWTVLSCTQNTDGSFTVVKSYLFGKNLESGSIGNNNNPGVKGNFTRYPLVQIAPQNYRSGTLRSLIGTIDYAGGQNEYSDTLDLRDEIYELSTTTNFLFLKTRKGDLWMIRPSGEIVMETMDNTREQAQTVSFPWVETGDTEGISIYQVTG